MNSLNNWDKMPRLQSKNVYFCPYSKNLALTTKVEIDQGLENIPQIKGNIPLDELERRDGNKKRFK